MNIEITERIPRDKWLAALGTHGTRDESLNETLDEVESALLAAAKPKAIYRVMDIADIKVQGFSLKKHLEGCHKVIVMALTLGAGTDNLIRKLQVTDMAKAVMADSGASVLVECLCDTLPRHGCPGKRRHRTGLQPGGGMLSGTAAGGLLYLAVQSGLRRLSSGNAEVSHIVRGRTAQDRAECDCELSDDTEKIGDCDNRGGRSSCKRAPCHVR